MAKTAGARLADTWSQSGESHAMLADINLLPTSLALLVLRLQAVAARVMGVKVTVKVNALTAALELMPNSNSEFHFNAEIFQKQ